MQDIHIHSGGLWFGSGLVRLRTLLGSCVAITLWHPRLRVGGLCHFITARAPVSKGKACNGCYGDSAMAMLQEAIIAAGLVPRQLEAKLFGGGQMFVCEERGPKRCLPNRVQVSNIAMGRALVRRYGHPLVAEHLGGRGHRSLVFDLSTGLAWIKHTPINCSRCEAEAA